jgi:hypothetical protein
MLVSERRTCAVVGQPRVTQRRRPLRDDEAALMADDVLQYLTDLFVEHGPPELIRSDNGLEFAAKAVRHWLGRVGVRTLFIEPDSPWRMATARASIRRSGTSCLTARYSRPFARPRSLSGTDDGTRHRQATPVARPPTTRILPPACGLPYSFAPSAHGLA